MKKYKVGTTFLGDGACFYQTYIDYIDTKDSLNDHYEIITVCGNIPYNQPNAKKSSRKLAKKIVKLLNEDLEKSQKKYKKCCIKND